MKRFACALCCLALAAVFAVPAQAQGYGSSVAVAGDEILVGESLNNRTPGIIYVYRRSDAGTWDEHAQLVASDGTNNDHFGRFIAVNGNTMIAGATVWNENTGAAYVFEKDPASGEWREAQRLVASGLQPGDSWGRAAAMDGDAILIAAWGHADGKGGVWVFERNDSGMWTESAKLMASDAEENIWFGWGLALEGDVAFVGSSRKNNRTGVVYVFQRDATSGAWSEVGILQGNGTENNSRFGQTIMLQGDRAFIAAPGHDRFSGAIYVFERDAASGEWTEQQKLLPFDATSGTQFGATLNRVGDELWVGAPGADGQGSIYRFARDASGSNWTGVAKLRADDPERGERFAGALAVHANLAVVGLTGDDYGAGTVAIFERNAGNRMWTQRAKVWSEVEGLDPMLGEQVECANGTAGIFACDEVDVLAFMPVQSIGGTRGVHLNDVWGWTDPQTGKEYALVGRVDGTSFIDVTDPSNPVYLGNLNRTEGSPGRMWRDMKVYKDHAFIVSDRAGAHGMQVFDLTQLRNVRNAPVEFKETAHYDGIFSAHNIVINENSGYAFAVGSNGGGETCGGGLHMINIEEPARPTFAGCFADTTTGNQKTGYSHDAQCVIYHGPDVEHDGKEICFGSNETALSIADVSDKKNPVPLSSATYPNVSYVHQAWIDDEHRYLYMGDEGDEFGGDLEGTRTLVWDVTDLDDPIMVKEYIAETKSTDHNLYIKGNYAYQSNYVSGLRVLDISDRENPVLVGFFDTEPFGEDEPGFKGSWSNYPFFASGVIVVTSMYEGVFLLKKKETLVP